MKRLVVFCRARGRRHICSATQAPLLAMDTVWRENTRFAGPKKRLRQPRANDHIPYAARILIVLYCAFPHRYTTSDCFILSIYNFAVAGLRLILRYKDNFNQIT